MSIATKCTCGASAYCTGHENCHNSRGKSLAQFLTDNNCTDEEACKVRAYLFALRHSNINMYILENIIKRYKDIL